MHHKIINVTTGPVGITPEVAGALGAATISHRSKEFHRLYEDTTNHLSRECKVRNTFLLTGSGTAANEVMIWQIKMQEGRGLILSNGEFGSRLVEQAKRASLLFYEYHLPWGEAFSVDKIERIIADNRLTWILFCHCETSTGMLNDLSAISAICRRTHCLCFVDCMSTAGTSSIDLSDVTIATASSGKGLASLPGLAVVFSNIDPVSSDDMPVYFDLGHYHNKAGIPFTISSNLVNALYVSIRQKLCKEQFDLIDYYADKTFRLLREKDQLCFKKANSKVFTIKGADKLVPQFEEQGIIVSHESEYLQKRNYWQLALFGYYQEEALQQMICRLENVVKPDLIRLY